MLPTVLNINGPVVIFGGGNVGLRKVEYVSRFTNDIIVIAEETEPMPDHVIVKKVSLESINISEYIPDNASLVIAALSDQELNKTISEWCKKKQILVNVVDDTEKSTILFPALSKSGDLNIAISTSGKCPFLARKIREGLDDLADEKVKWLELLSPFRDKLVGIEKKNEVLNLLYNNREIIDLIVNNKLDEARKKAEEIFNVHNEL